MAEGNRKDKGFAPYRQPSGGEEMTDGDASSTDDGYLYLIQEFEVTSMPTDYYKFEDYQPSNRDHKIIDQLYVTNMRKADRALQKAFKDASDDQKEKKGKKGQIEWYMFESIEEAKSKFREALKPWIDEYYSIMNK